MYDGIDEPIEELTFGNAINAVKNWIDRNGSCILIVEAVLSTFHNKERNPDIRDDFENRRGWYYGPRVVTFTAAMRFLKILRNVVLSMRQLYWLKLFYPLRKVVQVIPKMQ
jgi:hypothetical protein